MVNNTVSVDAPPRGCKEGACCWGRASDATGCGMSRTCCCCCCCWLDPGSMRRDNFCNPCGRWHNQDEERESKSCEYVHPRLNTLNTLPGVSKQRCTHVKQIDTEQCTGMVEYGFLTCAVLPHVQWQLLSRAKKWTQNIQDVRNEHVPYSIWRYHFPQMAEKA